MSEFRKRTRVGGVLATLLLAAFLVAPVFAQSPRQSTLVDNLAARLTLSAGQVQEAIPTSEPVSPTAPTAPSVPAVPIVPTVAAQPALTSQPAVPTTPDEPEVMSVQPQTQVPEPDQPSLPDQPTAVAAPVEPVVPTTPAVIPVSVPEPSVLADPVSQAVTQVMQQSDAVSASSEPALRVSAAEPVAEPAVEPVAEPAAAESVAAPVTSSEPEDAPPAVIHTTSSGEMTAEVAAKTTDGVAAPAQSPAQVQIPSVKLPLGANLAARQKGAEKAYIKRHLVNVFVFIMVLLCLVVFFTIKATRGEDLFIRRISGLSALDDAVGRATEMGRGVLYIPGIMDMDDIQTIAGVTILGHVARKTAEYDTPLFAPMSRSFTMSVAQEVVKQSYLEKGCATQYRQDRINYLTDDQFGYVAGASGIMLREKPAACFFLGTFYAESLILAETGHSVGAIQIAGTAEPSQIPFFVAACDYTLIGEELFAASAYLSRNPKEVGSLKGQDWAKVLLMFLMLLGSLLLTGNAMVNHFQPADAESSVQQEDSWAQSYIKLFKK